MEAKDFNAEEQAVWRTILSEHRKKRGDQICDLFLKGVEELGIVEDQIPDMRQINRILSERSGFRGEFVRGYEEGNSFYPMLSERRFPIGNFIRSSKDLSYTPEPDVVHDLYGHMPFFIDRD